MSSSNEKSALVSAGSPKKFYFLHPEKNGTSTAQPTQQSLELGNIHDEDANNVPKSYFSWFQSFFNKPRDGYQVISSSTPSVPGTNNISSKPRSVPVKVEPKVFFANERTFLAWLHMAVTLASISVAIVAFAESNEWSQFYGLLLLPVSIAFCGYALYMYMLRASMIRRKMPGPYEDRVGPIVLAVLLGSAITINFFVKLYHLSTRT